MKLVHTNDNCIGCNNHNIKQHKGKQCIIKDWERERNATGEKGKIIQYINLLKFDFVC